MQERAAGRLKLVTLEDRATTARQRAQCARTTQDRLHFEGMANYWEELLAEERSRAMACEGVQRAA